MPTCLGRRVPRHLAKRDFGVSVGVFGGVWGQESEYGGLPSLRAVPPPTRAVTGSGDEEKQDTVLSEEGS